MWSYAKRGWLTARTSWFLIFFLFLYQYGWGFAIYKYVKSTVVPLLHRYPGGELPDSAGRLFWLEAEFQLTKTDLMVPYIWTIGLILLFRLLVTPLVNAGVYSSLAKRDGSQRKTFLRGIRMHAKPFLLLYLLQALLTFAPFLWAVPRILEAAAHAQDWMSVATAALPYAAGWMAYQGLLDLIFMYIGFGIVDGRGGFPGLVFFARRSLPAVGLALATFAIAGAVSLAAAALSLWWAGFLAVIIHQSYPVVRAMLKLWFISSQHHLWSAR